MPRKHNWWLTGIGCFTAVLFAVQALIAYQALEFRQDNYYLVSMIVFGALTFFSLFAVVQGWRNSLPGQRAQGPEPADDEPPAGES
jgi:hypothetical protein